MNKYIILLIFFFSVKTSTAQFREFGFFGGPSLINARYTHPQPTEDGQTYGYEKPLFFHLGLQSQWQLKPKIQLRTSFLFGGVGADVYSDFKGQRRTEYVRNNYLAISGLVSYTLISNLFAGVGVEPTYYFSVNNGPKEKVPIDISPSVQLTYRLLGLELSANYRLAIFNVVKPSYFTKMKYNEFRFSLYVPLYNKERYKQRRERADREMQAIEAMEDE